MGSNNDVKYAIIKGEKMNEDYIQKIQLINIRNHLAELELRNAYLGNSRDGYQIGVDFQTNQPIFRRSTISEEMGANFSGISGCTIDGLELVGLDPDYIPMANSNMPWVPQPYRDYVGAEIPVEFDDEITLGDFIFSKKIL